MRLTRLVPPPAAPFLLLLSIVSCTTARDDARVDPGSGGTDAAALPDPSEPETGEPETAATVPPSPAPSALADMLSAMGVRLSTEDAVLEIDGWVNLHEGAIEVVACSPGGKEHESLLVLDCLPSAVHAGLLALGLEPGPHAIPDSPLDAGADQGAGNGTPPPARGAAVSFRVRWRTGSGVEEETAVENWILDLRSGTCMPPTHWVFTGSVLMQSPAGASSSLYAADQVGSIVTTFHDRSTVLDNPLPEGADDTIYAVHSERVPPVGTPVVAVLVPRARASESRP